MSEMNYDPAVKDSIDGLLLGMPGVSVSKMFGYPGYRARGKVFCFVGGRGVAIKLPEKRVAALIAQGAPYRQFEVSDGVVWKAWVSIDRDDPAEYAQELPLFEEALGFVTGS